MKYGLMYYKSTDNIGDDIQTYVAIKYLPHIDYYIDREALSCFVPKEKEYVSMIMNGWYIHNKLAWPPSPYINPLLISMHFKDLEETDVGDSYLKEFGGEFLKRYEPVGARDIETQKRLSRNGIKSYFSGCMTLTLEKFPNIDKKEKICLVDVNEKVIEKVKENTKHEIEILTHFLNPQETEKKSISQRMSDVENLLKKYQESKLVITNRLHVALPCVALGTSVIVLHKKFYDEDRLGIFLNLVTDYIDEDFLKMDIAEILENPKPNSEEYVEIRNRIDKTCKDFILKCENTDNKNQSIYKCFNLNNDYLPEIQEYEKYTKKLNWYKEIFEKERVALENIEHKRVQEYELYHKNLKELNEKSENNCKEIESINLINMKLMQDKEQLKSQLNEYQNKNIYLNEELNKIYNSRSWKYLQKVKKILNW